MPAIDKGKGMYITRFQRHLLAFFFLADFFLLPMQAYATHPLITDDAYTQGKGNKEAELDMEYSMNEDGQTRQEVYQLKSIISYGASKNADIVLTVPYWFFHADGQTADGLSDVTLEYKYRLYEKGPFLIALKPGISVPTGNAGRGLGAGRPNYWITLISTLEAEPDLLFHANAQFICQPNTSGYIEKTFSLTLATEYGFTKKMKLVGNIGTSNNPGTVSLTPKNFILAGLVYSPTERVDLDGGIKAGFNRPGNNYGLLFGLTRRF